MVQGLQRLLYAKTRDEFNALWVEWLRHWLPGYKHIVDYFKQWWIKRLVRWAMAWRQVHRLRKRRSVRITDPAILAVSMVAQYAHDGVDTNNYIESYHNYLKVSSVPSHLSSKLFI
jgi:hypothetical protein